uniref:Uncharacterized protein n=1 Tax=Nelumbo nucifera TaxID=4432 RepID=A0A822XJ62_NELNU|nr:TPA_asm: hypothetical protein HUJ06_021902 [Nelumbo nucifera]DAD20440.1 TPA_asm: hypothetical protein HUJ06_021903 [Nelumbo nucifera]
MATLQTLLSCSSSSSCQRRIKATLHAPKLQRVHLSVPKLPTKRVTEDLNIKSGYSVTTTIHMDKKTEIGTEDDSVATRVIMELYAIADMHGSSPSSSQAIVNPLVFCSYGNTDGDEQDPALSTTLDLGSPTPKDVKDTMEKVLALDRAYPLPLLGTMLDKFPATVEPAVWWPSGCSPEQLSVQQKKPNEKMETNGWNNNLEEEMRQILGVLRRRDMEEYNRLGKLALKINKVLAISGPLLTGIAAVGSGFVGSPSHGSSAVLVSVAGGALAIIVNTMEHGGQVGMVFEMYRNCAGFFRLLEESIESTLNERDTNTRENGELSEIKVALQLGRSVTELRDLAASSSCAATNATEEFASKLF